MFLKLDRADISLCKCHYSDYQAYSVGQDLASSWHVPKGKERKGKMRVRLSHWDCTQKKGQGGKALMQGRAYVDKETKKEKSGICAHWILVLINKN